MNIFVIVTKTVSRPPLFFIKKMSRFFFFFVRLQKAKEKGETVEKENTCKREIILIKDGTNNEIENATKLQESENNYCYLVVNYEVAII